MGFKFNPTTGKLDTVADPGGSDTHVQFNDGSVFGGVSDLTYNKTTKLLTNKGDVNLDDGGSFTTTLQTITPTANRTISLPDATGTVALVAGSSGQLVWNSSGAYAGASTLTYDGSILTTSGRFINSYTSLASAPAKTFTGSWFTGGTATTTKPHFLIEPTGTTSTAWSTSGTGLGVNAASGFAGNLLDLQVNGTSQLRVNSAGSLLFPVDNAADIGASGSNRPKNVFIAGYLQIGTTQALWINTRFILKAPSDGVATLLNNGETDFSRLQFGGTSSSFPALKRSSATLQARLADDSGYTTIDAQLRAQGTAPASATAAGTAGDVRYDADYVYVCTAANTWKRAALSTW